MGAILCLKLSIFDQVGGGFRYWREVGRGG